MCHTVASVVGIRKLDLIVQGPSLCQTGIERIASIGVFIGTPSDYWAASMNPGLSRSARLLVFDWPDIQFVIPCFLDLGGSDGCFVG